MSSPAVQRLTPKKRAAFLVKLAETGNVVRAAKAIRCSRDTLYTWRRADPEFAQAWEAALTQAMDAVLEPEALRRAVDGVLKPVWYQGVRVGTVREYSDTLLIFLLKGGKPEKYKERLDVQHKGVVTLLHKLSQVASMSEAELEAFTAEVQSYVNQYART